MTANLDALTPATDGQGRVLTTPLAQAQSDLLAAADRVSRAWVGYRLPRPDHGPAMKALNDALRAVAVALDEEHERQRTAAPRPESGGLEERVAELERHLSIYRMGLRSPFEAVTTPEVQMTCGCCGQKFAEGDNVRLTFRGAEHIDCVRAAATNTNEPHPSHAITPGMATCFDYTNDPAPRAAPEPLRMPTRDELALAIGARWRNGKLDKDYDAADAAIALIGPHVERLERQVNQFANEREAVVNGVYEALGVSPGTLRLGETPAVLAARLKAECERLTKTLDHYLGWTPVDLANLVTESVSARSDADDARRKENEMRIQRDEAVQRVERAEKERDNERAERLVWQNAADAMARAKQPAPAEAIEKCAERAAWEILKTWGPDRTHLVGRDIAEIIKRNWRVPAPPATMGVRMPERCPVASHGAECAWNACLAEVRRLNPGSASVRRVTAEDCRECFDSLIEWERIAAALNARLFGEREA